MKYRSGYKYQLAFDFLLQTRLRPTKIIYTEFITLYMDGKMVIRRAYSWDGASGPTWDTANTMVPALYHDAAAQLLRQGLLPPEAIDYANAEFDDMLKARGMWWPRRRIWQIGLWLTGGSFADPENQKEVHEAD
jgi:hypothetical protein